MGVSIEVPGNYRIAAQLEAFQAQQPVTYKIIAKRPSGDASLIKVGDLDPGEPAGIETDVYLEPGDSETKKLRSQASASDNHLLDDYLQSVRQAETKIAAAQGWMNKPKASVDVAPLVDINDPSDLIGRTQLLMDLVPLVVQTDSSRVITVMVQDHAVVPKVEGVSADHHNLSHHGQDPTKIGQLEKIEAGIVGCFGSLLEQVKRPAEFGSRLLDNTTIVFGSNLGNANSHEARNLPIFLAGGGYDHGRYVDLRKVHDQPLCNLFVRLMQDAGIEMDAFGQSNGRLTWT
jgi:hypothetical protein